MGGTLRTMDDGTLSMCSCCMISRIYKCLCRRSSRAFVEADGPIRSKPCTQDCNSAATEQPQSNPTSFKAIALIYSVGLFQSSAELSEKLHAWEQVGAQDHTPPKH
jgi:hypothetical protein